MSIASVSTTNTAEEIHAPKKRPSLGIDEDMEARTPSSRSSSTAYTSQESPSPGLAAPASASKSKSVTFFAMNDDDDDMEAVQPTVSTTSLGGDVADSLSSLFEHNQTVANATRRSIDSDPLCQKFQSIGGVLTARPSSGADRDELLAAVESQYPALNKRVPSEERQEQGRAKSPRGMEELRKGARAVGRMAAEKREQVQGGEGGGGERLSKLVKSESPTEVKHVAPVKDQPRLERDAPRKTSFASVVHRAMGENPRMKVVRERLAKKSAELSAERMLRKKLEREQRQLERALEEADSAIQRMELELEAIRAAESPTAAMMQVVGGFLGSIVSIGSSSSSHSARRSSSTFAELQFQEFPCGQNVSIAPGGRVLAFSGCKGTAGNADEVGLFAFAGTTIPVGDAMGHAFEVVVRKTRKELADGFAIGFTSSPPSDWPDQLPETADCLGDKLWMAGYANEFVDAGQWRKSSWDSSSLQAGDVVRVSLSIDSVLEVMVNDEGVFKEAVECDMEDCPPLFGVVDLLANVDEVMLLG